jgi:hypothetical protein
MPVRLCIPWTVIACLCACSGDPGAGQGGDSGVTDASTPDVPADDSGLGLRCTGASYSFQADIVPLMHGCAGSENCHGSFFANHAAMLSATTQRDMCDPARVLVTAGDLAHSYLLNKLTGIDMCPMSHRMPIGGNDLPEAQIQRIADWICEGAPNN